MKNSVLYLILISISILFLISCEIQDERQTCEKIFGSDPGGRVLSYSECKNDPGLFSKIYLASDEYVEFRYFENYQLLGLTHINTGMNCCPEKITADIKITGNRIVITEFEAKVGCKCECLFDVNYELRNIYPGSYTLEIYGPITDGILYAPFVCDIDVTQTDSTSFSMRRGFYPWGE